MALTDPLARIGLRPTQDKADRHVLLISFDSSVIVFGERYAVFA
jgi:hypothetical protein